MNLIRNLFEDFYFVSFVHCFQFVVCMNLISKPRFFDSSLFPLPSSFFPLPGSLTPPEVNMCVREQHFSITFASTHLWTQVERGAVRIKCLAQEHKVPG